MADTIAPPLPLLPLLPARSLKLTVKATSSSVSPLITVRVAFHSLAAVLATVMPSEELFIVTTGVLMVSDDSKVSSISSASFAYALLSLLDTITILLNVGRTGSYFTEVPSVVEFVTVAPSLPAKSS